MKTSILVLAGSIMIGLLQMPLVAAVSAPLTVVPSNGTGTGTVFTFTFDSTAASPKFNVIINYQLDGNEACFFDYDVTRQSVSLAGDSITAWSPFVTIGSDGAELSNSRCYLDLSHATASTAAGRTTLSVPIQFSPRFAGHSTIYAGSTNSAGQIIYAPVGQYGINFPYYGGETVWPSSGSGANHVFQYIFNLPSGMPPGFDALINTSVDGTHACWFYLDLKDRSLALAADSSSQPWSNPLRLGQEGAQLSNSQCTIDVAQTSVSTAGTQVIVKVPTYFKPSFEGLRNIYVAIDANFPYQQVGTWSVTGISTGTHWAAAEDLWTLSTAGYSFALTSFDPSYPPSWPITIAAARASKLKLIATPWPPPYQFNDHSWTISNSGLALFKYLQGQPDVIMGLMGFNEPYWTDPLNNGATNVCGVYSADDLRGFRNTILAVWPQAKIFHDIGSPSSWAPNGPLIQSYPCIGNKYADQTGIADYVGIFYYPFTANGYLRSGGLADLQTDIQFVHDHMQPAKVIVDAQSFQGNGFSATAQGSAMPTAAQILDWNCALRGLPVDYISWYVWQQASYADYLSKRPDLMPYTKDSVCKSYTISPTVPGGY